MTKIKEMISFTPGDHVDSPDLLKAHEKLVRIANQIENESAEAQSISRVLELANMFIYDGVPFKLVSPSRRYIMETESLSIFPSYSLQDVSSSFYLLFISYLFTFS